MAEGILYRCRARVRFLRDAGEEFEAWKQGHAQAVQVRDLEGWAEDCLSFHKDIRAIHTALLALFAGGEVPLAEGGEILLRLFDAVLHLTDVLLADIRTAEQSGQEVT